MKVVILAGGYGTRISEESHLIPKPMIEIGGKPILWHIMKMYSHYGHNDFIICLGYKAYKIKEYFANYYLHTSDVTFNMKDNTMKVHNNFSEPWNVTLIDTGLDTMTGGRVKRIQEYVGDETFMLTYGDGVCDLNINELIEFHKNSKFKATLTAVRPEGRFGILEIGNKSEIHAFREKSKDDMGYINGGFMVLEKEIFDYLRNDNEILERFPLESLAQNNELGAYKYNGFWQCMDTLRDKEYLEELIEEGKAKWKKW
ncbi:MAG: glucose-1-phosphate cytidylyltransferase [Bacilli bacterium]